MVVPEAVVPVEESVAVIVVVPTPCKVAKPGLVLEKTATLVLDELQVVEEVTF